MRQGAIATAAFAASPASIFDRDQESSRGPKTVAEIDKAAIRKLASHVQGQIIAPADPGYASACQDWTGNIPQKPGLVVRSARSEDIVATVNFARDHELPLAVRSGGHGLRSTEGGILLDLSGMKGTEVNVPERVANVQAGVKLGAP